MADLEPFASDLVLGEDEENVVIPQPPVRPEARIVTPRTQQVVVNQLISPVRLPVRCKQSKNVF